MNAYVMNAYEFVALNEYLSAYPDDRTFDEVMGMLTGDVIDETDEVIVWEVFEHMPREAVAEYIDNLKDTLERNFIPKEQEK
jgi:hypothetical protein